MKYIHTQVFRTRGVTVSADDGHKELIVDAVRGLKAVLANNLDELIKEADRSLAVAKIFLMSVLGSPNPAPITEAIATKMEEIRDSRNLRE